MRARGDHCSRAWRCCLLCTALSRGLGLGRVKRGCVKRGQDQPAPLHVGRWIDSSDQAIRRGKLAAATLQPCATSQGAGQSRGWMAWSSRFVAVVRLSVASVWPTYPRPSSCTLSASLTSPTLSHDLSCRCFTILPGFRNTRRVQIWVSETGFVRRQSGHLTVTGPMPLGLDARAARQEATMPGQTGQCRLDCKSFVESLPWVPVPGQPFPAAWNAIWKISSCQCISVLRRGV